MAHAASLRGHRVRRPSQPGAGHGRPGFDCDSLSAVAAVAWAIVMAAAGVALFIGALALVEAAYRSWLVIAWAAFSIIALCLLLTLAAIVQQARRAHRTRVEATAARRAVSAALRALAMEPVSRQRELQGLIPQLRLIVEAAETLLPTEQDALRYAFADIGTASVLKDRLERTRRKWRRVELLRLLSWTTEPAAISTLREALQGPDLEQAYAAGQALARYESDDAYEVLFEALGAAWLPRARVAALLESSQCLDALPLLERHAGDPDPQVRFWVAYLLGRSGSSGAARALAWLVGDRDAEVRANAAEAFGAIPGHTPLGTLLRDEHWLVRAHAAKAAGECGRADLAPVLVELLRDRQWWVRQDAALALKQIGPQAIACLVPILRSDDRFARNKAAEVLVYLGYASDQLAGLGGGPAEVRAAISRLSDFERAEALGALKAATLARCPPDVRSDVAELLAA